MVRDDYIYRFNKQTSSKIFLICKAKNRSSTIHTETIFNCLQSNREHSHLRESEDIEVQRFRKVLKNRVINETALISKVYDEEISKLRFLTEMFASVLLIRDIREISFFDALRIPRCLSSEPSLNQALRKLTPPLPGPTSFDISESYQTTTTGTKFSFASILVCRKRRMFIFPSPNNLN